MNTPLEPSADEPTLPPAPKPAIPVNVKLGDVHDTPTAGDVNPPGASESDAAAESEGVQNTGNVYTRGLRVCGNCGTELLGDTCYRCGQPIKGLVRQFSSIVGDFLDTVLNIDTRVFRTVGPLIYKPGFLTQEYFSGRRIRYVSPVRLFFFLAVVTFLLAQFSLPENMGPESQADGFIKIDGVQGDAISRAKTVAEVQKTRNKALKELTAAQKEMPGGPAAEIALEQTKAIIDRKAEKRIADLTGKKSSASKDDEGQNHVSFDGEIWDAEKNPIKVGWLPDFANRWLNSLAQRAENNGKLISKDPKMIVEALLSALPMTLFLMLPVFALLLKAMFIFKRRLYMEHLIVALHSHAFLMLAIMLQLLMDDLAGLLATGSWLHTPINILTVLLWLWMPIYLFLMQKRVYQQGWIMTFIKYAVIGNFYLVLLSLAIGFTLIFKMIWL